MLGLVSPLSQMTPFGSLAEVRFYTCVLNASEIQALAARPFEWRIFF